jgi:hypothetical protein
MSSVGSLAAARRPEGGWSPDEVWGDLDMPGWQDFTQARERFFAGLRGLEPLEAPEGGERPQDHGEASPEDV